MKHDGTALVSFLVPAVMSLLLGSVLVLGLAGCQAAGPTYPSREITYILPFAQGSSSDLSGRTLLETTLANWPEAAKVKVTVKNDAAGGGTGAAAAVYSAKPDGYTIGMIQIMPLTMQPHLMKDQIPYKGPEDFKIVNQIFARTTCLVVRPDSKYNTVKDLIDDIKSGNRKEPFTYAGRGVGNAEHLTMEMLAKAAGVPREMFKVVPYQSDGEGIAAVLGGHIDGSNFMWATHKALVEEKRLKVLFVVMPFPGMEKWGLKSAKDFGYDIQFSPRHYTIMPKDTPKEIVDVVNEKFRLGMHDKKFTDYLEKVGDFLLYTTGDETMQYVKSQFELQGQMVKELGLAK